MKKEQTSLNFCWIYLKMMAEDQHFKSEFIKIK